MATATATPTALGEIRVLREQVQAIGRTLHVNSEGLTQEESLAQPQPGGNCLNWVVGHIMDTWDILLPIVGQQPVLGREALTRYKRGTAELRDSAEAMPFADLLAACDEAARRMDAGLAAVTSEKLDEPAPFSPRKNPDETVRSLLSVVIFHQAYHAGQTGLIRRIVGKEGKIK